MTSTSRGAHHLLLPASEPLLREADPPLGSCSWPKPLLPVKIEIVGKWTHPIRQRHLSSVHQLWALSPDPAVTRGKETYHPPDRGRDKAAGEAGATDKMSRKLPAVTVSPGADYVSAFAAYHRGP